MRIQRVATGLLVVSAAFLWACRPASQPPNIILISIDTLRADHLGCYGYDRPTSPAIDGLAARGIRFEPVVANSPWTLPTHASMLTGLYPRTHGVTNRNHALSASVITVAERLREAGYDTAGFVNCRFLAARYNMHRGFDRYEYTPERLDKMRTRSGVPQIEEAIEHVTANRDRPFFLFLHNFDVHSDYDPSPRYREMFVSDYDGPCDGTTANLTAIRDGKLEIDETDVRHLIELYDAGLRQLDDILQRLFDTLANGERARDTYVIFTSDHGEAFAEHGSVLHGQTVYEETLSIPLIVAGPDVPAGVTVPGPVQSVDISPTILELAGLSHDESVEGLSLVGTWKSGLEIPEDRTLFAHADRLNAEPDAKRMIRKGSTKLIYDRVTGEVELFDLSIDPGEQRNIASDHPGLVESLTSAMEEYLSGKARPAEVLSLSEEELEHLRALGYVD